MLKRFINSCGFALKGIASACATEVHMRIHLAAAVAVIAAGFWFGCTPVEWASIAIAIVVVIAAELFNTAIEELAGQVTTEPSPAIGRIKDVSAGAVLVCAVGAAVVGGVIFLPKILG